MLKVGVLSDTHILNGKDLPKKIIEAFGEVDTILHAGDLTDLSVLDKLKEINPNVFAVRGNMDNPKTRNNLPEKLIIPLGNFRIGLTHGKGSPQNIEKTVKDIFQNEKVDCIVFGHSHTPENKVFENILYFNPGSSTDKVFAPYNSYGILEISQQITGKIIKI